MATSSPASSGDALKLPDVDELIEEILAEKGPTKCTGGLSEEKWEEELEQIPLFMTQAPEQVDAESAPALAALQDLKYSEGTPQDRALAFKEDGNEQFKKMRYKAAITAYTAGLREQAEDGELVAILYCNRAAAQYHLKNYRSALTDATEALKAKPDHMKAIIRGAQCCAQLGRHAEAMEWCDEGMRRDPTHGKLRDIRRKAALEKKRQDRDKRKEAAVEGVKNSADQRLLDVIKSRGIRLANSSSDEEGQPLELQLKGPHPSVGRVHLSPGGALVWPVILLYPEFGQTDYIAAFTESDRFVDHVTVLYHEPLPWDEEGKYRADTVELYYEDHSTGRLHLVNLADTLNSVLASEGYVVVSGTPSFVVLSTASSFREHFLART